MLNIGPLKVKENQLLFAFSNKTPNEPFALFIVILKSCFDELFTLDLRPNCALVLKRDVQETLMLICVCLEEIFRGRLESISGIKIHMTQPEL